MLTDPEDDEAYLILGHTYLLSGEYVKAEEAFQNAVHIDPANIREIAPFYQNLLLENPGDDQAHSNLGYALLILGNFTEAKQAFQDALSINPQNADANAGLAVAVKNITGS